MSLSEGMEGDPFGGGDVAGGLEVARDEFTEIVNDDVVVFGAALEVGHDALEDGGDGGGADAKTCFFKDFADNGGFKALSRLDEAAGEGPPAFQRGLAALNEEDFVPAEDDGADSQQWARGVVAGVDNGVHGANVGKHL